jgi:hypothetical protein
MGGVALRWCGFGGGRSKIATAIAPITASRDKRVDHRAAADEIRRPLGNSWLADAFNRVPRDIAMARFPAPGRVLLRLSQNTGPPVRFPSMAHIGSLRRRDHGPKKEATCRRRGVSLVLRASTGCDLVKSARRPCWHQMGVVTMRFMVIVKATKDSEAGVMPSEKMLGDMAKFNEELVKAGVMLSGDGLHPSSKGARIRFSGTERIVMDGPFAETKELIAGYWIIQVKSKAEAIDWMKRCPNPYNQDGEIEIRQVFELEDFGESAAIEHHRALGETLAKKS